MKNKEANTYYCIVTGAEKYIPPSLAKAKIQKFGSQEEFQKHYVSSSTAKLLRAGNTVDEIRTRLNIVGMPKIKPLILTRLNLLRKKKGLRGKQSVEREERQKYLNSQEFKDKRSAWKERQQNMTFPEWVKEYTGTGRARGGTCIRPDVFLSWNNKACDGCQCYEYCMCYQKRISHEKRKPKKR